MIFRVSRGKKSHFQIGGPSSLPTITLLFPYFIPLETNRRSGPLKYLSLSVRSRWPLLNKRDIIYPRGHKNVKRLYLYDTRGALRAKLTPSRSPSGEQILFAPLPSSPSVSS